MKTRQTRELGKQVMVDGMMAFGKTETGQHVLDFQCCEDVEAEPFSGEFKVSGMRDGNVYMEQKKPRKRNKPLFRYDNMSFSHGHDGRFYCTFIIDDWRLPQVPQKLMHQASVIAQKVMKELIIHNS